MSRTLILCGVCGGSDCECKAVGDLERGLSARDLGLRAHLETRAAKACDGLPTAGNRPIDLEDYWAEYWRRAKGRPWVFRGRGRRSR